MCDAFTAGPGPVRRSSRRAALLLASLALLWAACERPTSSPAHPSILLVVVDTLRRDAVSAYGAVQGTTPHMDALAREGLVYHHAYAPAPWTLPSHASLLTALPVEAHRIGMPGRLVLPEERVTIAERLRAVGYQTLALSENMIVGDVTGLFQGFDDRASNTAGPIGRGEDPSKPAIFQIRVGRALEKWLRWRDPDRPAFVFINLFDAHGPYEVRDRNPWVPEGTRREEIEARSPRHELLICSRLPARRELDILRGLYLGDVAAADRKLGGVLYLVQQLGGDDWIIVVTSDHGEFLGERHLLGHEFSLGSPALDIPLIVRREGVAPAHIDAPVALQDVGAAILHWAGIEVTDGPRAVPLPEEPSTPVPPRDLFAAYSDRYVLDVEQWKDAIFWFSKDAIREGCSASDPVWGEKAALIRYPHKLLWHRSREPELYDLRADPREAIDLARERPDVVAQMEGDVESILTSSGLFSDAGPGVEAPSPDALRALKELGYVE